MTDAGEQRRLARSAYRVRRLMGWATVLMSATAVGLGAFLVWRILGEGTHPLFLLEPAIVLVFGLAILPVANSFMDPRKCGLPEDR